MTRAVVAAGAGLEFGLVATAFALGFRHGFDWDHLAALSDIAASQQSRRRSMTLATLYAFDTLRSRSRSGPPSSSRPRSCRHLSGT